MTTAPHPARRRPIRHGALTLSSLACLLASLVVSSGTASARTPDILDSLRLTVSSAFPANPNWVGTTEIDRTNLSEPIDTSNTTLTPQQLDITVVGGTDRRMINLMLKAPEGEQFQAGRTYDDNDYGAGQLSGDFAVWGTSCQGVRFTVLDVAANQGRLTRFDARFAVTCSTTIAQMIGEIQLGDDAGSPVLRSARAPGWFDVPVGTTSPASIPLWFRNTGPTDLTVGRSSLTGAASQDFKVNSDSCSGKLLRSGSSCSLLIGFTPTASGSRTATATLPIGSAKLTTSLTGTSPAGHTVLSMQSATGDYVGAGKSYLITDAQRPMDLDHGHSPASIRLLTRNGVDHNSDWDIDLIRPGDVPLAVGTYATSQDPVAGQVYLDVSGEGRGCDHLPGSGQVVIRQIGFDSSGLLSRLDMAFVQRCRETPTHPLTGQLSYRSTLAPQIPASPFTLRVGDTLRSGRTLVNTAIFGHTYRLTITATGRAVLTHDGRTVWTTPAAGPNATLQVMSDGRLTLSAASGAVVWSVPSAGGPARALVVQSDGDLALYRADFSRRWHTGTLEVPTT